MKEYSRGHAGPHKDKHRERGNENRIAFLAVCPLALLSFKFECEKNCVQEQLHPIGKYCDQ